jgi:L-ribulokinase
MARFSLGLDFGTNSIRAVIVDCADGREVGVGVAAYEGGDEGVFADPSNPNIARQDPLDYSLALTEAIKDAKLSEVGDFHPNRIMGIGVDTTGSTPLPVSTDGSALASNEHFRNHLSAYAWLWKDHSSNTEADAITAHATQRGEPYLAKCGGTYSSEWFWSKVSNCSHVAPDVFDSAHTWMECCDYIVGLLTGEGASVMRSICAAGHKGMYSDVWGGYPSHDFLAGISRELATVRSRLPDQTYTSDQLAGLLTENWAGRLGLPPGIPVAVGILDAHAGAVGSGVAPGRMVKIIGTSTCDILVGANLPEIPGVSGIVEGSVIPGLTSIEAGQSAVGDIFAWWSRMCGHSQENMTKEAARLKAGQSGLIALDWNNGNRNVLADPLLTGLIVGQTLHTTPAEVYRALIEATAFGALKIIKRIEEYGVEINELVACGGIAEKSPLTMQIYADVINRPIRLSRSAQAPALGAAIFGAVVGGVHPDVPTAQAAMTGFKEIEYKPDGRSAEIYKLLFHQYEELHEAFSHKKAPPVMKDLINIRNRVI